MSKTIKATQKQINVPDEGSGTHIGVEYGCRFPDGHHEWGTYSTGSYNASYDTAADPDCGHYDGGAVWRETLEKRARAANMDEHDYKAQHTLVKRQVILVTTAAEEV